MQDLKAIRENKFRKGYNDKLKPEMLPQGYAAAAINVLIEDDKIIKRTGYTEQGTDVKKSFAILGCGTMELSDGTKFILRARNKDASNSLIEGWGGSGAWGTLTSGSSQTVHLKHDFEMAKDVCYIFNGTDAVLKTDDGTSASAVSAIPKGVDMKWFHNYMFVLTAAGRLYWSNLNDPETYTADDYIDVNPNDGDTGIGFGVLKDELLTFKRNRVWALTGFGATDFTIDDLGERITGLGAQSKRSIVETGNDCYYLSYLGGVPHFTSVQRTRYAATVAGSIISDDISGTMDDLVKTALDECTGIFDGRRIWWAVTTSGSANDAVLVYDTLNKAWTKMTGIEASCWCISTLPGSSTLYFGEATAVSKLYKKDSSSTDNGTDISMQYDTRMYQPFPESKCKWKYLYMTAETESQATIDVDYSPDAFTMEDLGTMNTYGTGAVFDDIVLGSSKLGATTIQRKRFDTAGGNAYAMQYRFSNSETLDTIKIREYSVLYKPKGLTAEG